MAADKTDKAIVSLDMQAPVTNQPKQPIDLERDEDDDDQSAAQPGRDEDDDGPSIGFAEDRQAMGERMELDPRSLEKGWEYRWVHKHPARVSRTKRKGYVVVKPQQEPKIRNGAGEVLEPHADGTYSEGDLILMKCPRRIHRARRAAVEHQAQSRLGVAKKKLKRGFMRKARDAGVEVITTREPGKE